MTIPALLKKFGINVPRHVTVDGQIVIDSARSSYVASAVSVGQVNSIQPHRFHGGEDPSPPRDVYDDAWWNVDPAAKERDVADMKSKFSDVVVSEDNGGFDYLVRLNTGRGVFVCLVMPHVDGSLPSISVVQPRNLGRPQGKRFVKPPHLYTSGALCVAAESDWKGYNYPTSVAVGWAAHWLACYTEWRMSGIWPVDGFGVVSAS